MKRNKLSLKIRTLVASFGLLFATATPLLIVAQPVGAADSKSVVCESIGATGGSSGCGSSDGGINTPIKAAINLISIVAGIIAVIMIIVAGLKYITSSGDPSNITSAKNTLLYAIIGLVVVAFAQLIVKFVLAKATT